MEIIDISTVSRLVSATNWLSLDMSSRILVNVSSLYAFGEYDTDGTTSANMAEILLNEIVFDRIDSGLLWIRGIFPPDHAPMAIMLRLLESSDSRVLRGELGVKFEHDYEKLLATLSWALACSWSFDFIALPQSFLIQSKGNQEINMAWVKSQVMHNRFMELLTNINYTVRESS